MGISIFVTDDHALIRQGIEQILTFESDFTVVGDAPDGQTTIDKLCKDGVEADILLMDMNLPDMTGIELARQLKLNNCRSKIIVLTVNDGSYYAIEMFRIGACGYVLKSSEPDVMVDAIRTVYAGGSYVDKELPLVISELGESEMDISKRAKLFCFANQGKRLTTREVEVLHCIADGMSNVDMAKKLFVSDKTIKNHLTSIYRKLNVDDRTQALIYAIKTGLIGESDGYFCNPKNCGA